MRKTSCRLEISNELSLKLLDDVLLDLPSPNEIEEITVDLSDLRYQQVTGVVNLLLLLGYLDQNCKHRPLLIPPATESTRRFLSNARLFALAESYCVVDMTRPIPEPVPAREMAQRSILETKHIPPRETDAGFVNRLSRHLKNSIIEKLAILGDGRFAFLADVYLELSTNIFEHSQSFGFVAAQERDSMFQITIGDLGIGLFRSLQAFYEIDIERFNWKYGPLWDEAKALDIAFAAGASAKKALRPDEPAGSGLPTVLRSVRDHGGTVICRSGRHKMLAGHRGSSWQTAKKDNLAEFPGTQLEVYIPL